MLVTAKSHNDIFGKKTLGKKKNPSTNYKASTHHFRREIRKTSSWGEGAAGHSLMAGLDLSYLYYEQVVLF